MIGVNRRYRRQDPPLDGTEFVPKEPVVFDVTGGVPLETPKGTLVLLHSAMVHYSAENTSDRCRHGTYEHTLYTLITHLLLFSHSKLTHPPQPTFKAYSVHIVEGGNNVVYPTDNWLQRPPEHPFRVIP